MTTKLIADLIASGTPAELIVQVAELVAQVNTFRTQKELNAARQQRYRERHVTLHNARNVMSQPQQHIDIESKKDKDSVSKKDYMRGSRIDPLWAPSMEDTVFAKGLGMESSSIDLEAAKFRDYWTAKAGSSAVKRDWPATWRNWVRNNTKGAPTNGHKSTNGIMAALDKLTGTPGVRRPGDQKDVWLLSEGGGKRPGNLLGGNSGPVIDLFPTSDRHGDEPDQGDSH